MDHISLFRTYSEHSPQLFMTVKARSFRISKQLLALIVSVGLYLKVFAVLE